MFSSSSLMLVIICISAGIAFFLIYIAAASILYKKSSEKSGIRKRNSGDDWLLAGISKKLYVSIFGIRDPEEMAMKLGIEVEGYYKNCALLRIEPNVEKLVMNYLYGLACFAVFAITGFVSGVLYIALIGFGLLILFVYYERKSLESKTASMRTKVENELPNFLDLLYPELEIGVPVENAIYRLCSHTDYLLSREFMDAFNEVELGAKGWQQALEQVASKYDVDILNSFVLTITSAYNKGVSVTETVRREAEEVRKTYLLRKKEDAGKTENTVLVPIAIFQLLPLIVFLLMPAVVSFISM